MRGGKRKWMVQLLPFGALPLRWRIGTGIEGSTLTPALSQAWEREKAGRKEAVDVAALIFRYAVGAAVRLNLRGPQSRVEEPTHV